MSKREVQCPGCGDYHNVPTDPEQRDEFYTFGCHRCGHWLPHLVIPDNTGHSQADVDEPIEEDSW